MVSNFTSAQISLPGSERVAMTPFGARLVIHALKSETDGALGVWETFTPPGEGPAPHTHTRETEMFRVLQSTYRFWCADQVFDAPPGSVVVLPPNVEHAWRNIGQGMGRMLGIVTPGGCEGMFCEIAALGPGATAQQIASIEGGYGIINDETKKLGAKTIEGIGR
ncbi:cupin domain-containing protein [Rhizobium cremeum]|uniref:cupin domain-containing protein n=1 Tax=Rhizobium cremeum TaxID=2813827 RepID=UPI000DE44B88|nr:cupin domain-containing protein [Rhizobium cremeum]MCJ7996322.1 cupin domain-containing protein [Rhizobium cremeum]MCJ8001581.1 cupin domain-containing protein [Rhizobium cremeum]